LVALRGIGRGSRLAIARLGLATASPNFPLKIRLRRSIPDTSQAIGSLAFMVFIVGPEGLDWNTFENYVLQWKKTFSLLNPAFSVNLNLA